MKYLVNIMNIENIKIKIIKLIERNLHNTEIPVICGYINNQSQI